jgi:glycosyltransferase involved in cell wall biosynthesis
VRVLLVSHRFPPDDVGGVERYTQDMAAELIRSGDHVAVVARRSERGRKTIALHRERLPNGTLVYRLLAGVVSFEHFLEHHQRLEQMFTTAMIEFAPDVVHINHVMGLSPRLVQIARRLGAAVVLSLHDFYFACPRVHLQKPGGELCDGPNGGQECVRTCFPSRSDRDVRTWALRSQYFRRALAMADRIVCYSEYVGSYFKELVADRSRITLIPNGVPEQFEFWGSLRPGRRLPGTLSLAYCGTVAPHKGPHVLLNALRAAKLDRVALRIIGHCPEVEYAKRLREDAASIPGLSLQMYGTYERRQLPFLLQDIDCVVVPSLVPEAGPIVPREALAQGLPLVVARLGALTEIIREGENGFTFNPEKPGDLAGILRRIAGDEELRARLRAGARASPVVTLADHTRLIRSLYEEAIRDFSSYPVTEPQAAEEFTLIHQSLVEVGCDGSAQKNQKVGR